MKNKQVLVIGMGKSGIAARELLLSQGADVTCYDSNPALSFPAPESYESFELAVVSPGVPPSDTVFAEVLKKGIEWIGEAELALREIQVPIIGITGSNGKTTVTTLTAHILNFAGIPAFPLGNVGNPLSSFALNPKQGVVVAELSSFQLEGMRDKTLHAAVVLNITPNHLDRHPTMEAYREIKRRIGSFVKEGGTINLDGFSGGTFEEKNVAAARALTSLFGVKESVFQEALASFKKPPHRLAYVTTLNGVDYYNDSKGTNLDATAKAVESFQVPVWLIAGGKHKGSSYREWIPSFTGKIKGILLIGEAASIIEEDLRGHFPMTHCGTLERAVTEARQVARMGEVVLLSPGCSSYDQFKNFEERGEKFINCLTTTGK